MPYCVVYFEGLENLNYGYIKVSYLCFYNILIQFSLYSKGQIISECPLEILDFPKIPRKIWQISALESKKVVKS